MSAKPAVLLAAWVRARVPDSAGDWLQASLARVAEGGERDLALAFGLAPRKLGKADLVPTAAERAAAQDARPGWDPADWSIDQAARLALLLTAAGEEGGRMETLLELAFAAADLGERVCLYRGLPLYPGPERHLARAGEGLRTSMRAVFEAVAHASPYPLERFPDAVWNQMVVKAVFMEAALWPIQGLDARRNRDLAVMLLDFADERRSAGRPVTPELWRCVGCFSQGSELAAMSLTLGSDSPMERQAAALALTESPDPDARRQLDRNRPELAAAIAAGSLSWASIRP